MDLPTITRADVDKWRAYLKEYEPYTDEEYDAIPYDGEYNGSREKSTKALRLLKAFGLNPYDDNDYGNIPE
ncbi:MAG: hypothetical protein K2O42_10690 [Oscillospiraceae bacterium]|nr:hypothetical protein [Oscillospiraceae bacterium]